jgi:hypothetical protein
MCYARYRDEVHEIDANAAPTPEAIEKENPALGPFTR